MKNIHPGGVLQAPQSIRVFAPATVANMGPGFDIMGMTLEGVGDELEMKISPGDSLLIRNRTPFPLPENIEQNVVTPAIRALLTALGRTLHIEITLWRKILPGSGIGSSSASSAAAVFALNELLGRPFSERELIVFAMEGERLVSGGTAHADNAAPALCGGIQLIRGYHPFDLIRIRVPRSLHAAVIHPHITVRTADSRAVMRPQIPMSDAVTQWGNVGGLIAGLLTEDMELVGRSLCDAVAEPFRKGFIPEYDRLKSAALEAGALGANIAGSGPSVFALCDSAEKAHAVGAALQSHFDRLDIEADLYVCPVSERGARVIV